MCCTHFDAIDPGLNLPFGELFFLHFQITSKKHLFSIKMKLNNQKVANNVSSRVRVGIESALLSH